MKSTGCVLEVDGSAVESLVSKDRNHHTLVATDTITTRGKAGKGTLFNGTTSFVDCGNDTSLDIVNALTIEIWIKRNGSLGNNLGVVNKGIADGTRAFSDGFAATDGFLSYLSPDGTQTNRAYTMSNTLFNSLDVWNHIVTVFDGSIQTIKIYTNGIDDTGATTGTVPSSIYVSSDILRIGMDYNDYFNGTISSTRIYNYALSPTQIKRNYLSKAYLYQSHPVKIP